jgi:integrase
MSTTTPSQRLPKYRHHKARNLAVVRINGHDHYLGKYNSPETHAEYRRLVSEWLAHGITPTPVRSDQEVDHSPSINEVMVGYIKHVDSYYVKEGRPTSEVSLIRRALRVLRQHYGHTPAKDFGPLALKTVRHAFIDAGLCRREVNRRTGLVVRFFKWAVENELVPASVHHGLKAVSGLRKGRTEVRETEPVKPVPDADVDAVLPHVGWRVAAMIKLQRLTGMRPGEVIRTRTFDLDSSGKVWVYRPESHKTEHHGKSRQIFLGPRAQDVLKPWLKTDLSAYLFSPREAMEELRSERRRNRKTRVQPSQQNRRKRSPKKSFGDRYTRDSYRRAIAKGCEKAGVPHWHPNQLRHNAATWIRKEFGLDVARAVLGHSDATTTTIYAERDHALAASAMGRLG